MIMFGAYPTPEPQTIHIIAYGFPTCLTLVRSSVVCSRYASRIPVSGIAREFPVAHKVGWLVLGLHPAGARGVRSDSKEACARHEVGMSFARADGDGGPTETEVRT